MLPATARVESGVATCARLASGRPLALSRPVERPSSPHVQPAARRRPDRRCAVSADEQVPAIDVRKHNSGRVAFVEPWLMIRPPFGHDSAWVEAIPRSYVHQRKVLPARVAEFEADGACVQRLYAPDFSRLMLRRSALPGFPLRAPRRVLAPLPWIARPRGSYLGSALTLVRGPAHGGQQDGVEHGPHDDAQEHQPYGSEKRAGS
jgi:hypothetical protein